jgi:hypothetical protein
LPIHIRGGTSNEAVTVNVSGSASGGSITFQGYPGENAILDGTGLTVSGETGLINIVDRSYIKIVGLHQQCIQEQHRVRRRSKPVHLRVHELVGRGH